jgi:hypothetical protein
MNIGRFRAALDDDEMREFVAALDPIDLLGEASEGFVWRLVTDDGRPSSFLPVADDEDPLEAINLTVWESIDALRHYTYRSGHAMYLRRRREWFEPPTGPHLVCWWIPAGTVPTVAEGRARLARLTSDGPTPVAFTLAHAFDPEGRRIQAESRPAT